jgi:hypothetical protein
MTSDELRIYIYDILSNYADTYVDEIPENTESDPPTILFYFLNELPGFYADDTYFDRNYYIHVDLFQLDRNQEVIEAIESDLQAVFGINNFSKQISKDNGIYHFMIDFDITL